MVETGWGAGGPGDRMLWRSARFAWSVFASVPGRVDGDKKDSWISSRARGLKNRDRLIYVLWRDVVIHIYCSISGILRHVSHLMSDGYISFAVATKRDT